MTVLVLSWHCSAISAGVSKDSVIGGLLGQGRTALSYGGARRGRGRALRAVGSQRTDSRCGAADDLMCWQDTHVLGRVEAATAASGRYRRRTTAPASHPLRQAVAAMR